MALQCRLVSVCVFVSLCVCLSAQLTLTIWSNFICIVYCSPGTWSLVSFSYNILSLSLVTSTWTYVLWLWPSRHTINHPSAQPALFFSHPSPSFTPYHSIWSKDLFGILSDSPWFSPLSLCLSVLLARMCSSVRVSSGRAHEFNYISASTHAIFDIFQGNKILYC